MYWLKKGTSLHRHYFYFDRLPTHREHSPIKNNQARTKKNTSARVRSEFGVLSSRRWVFRGEKGGGTDSFWDRRWQICLTTNVHLSAYWRALSQWWFMPKKKKSPHTLPLPSPSRHSSFQHLQPCGSLCFPETKSGLPLSLPSTQSGLRGKKNAGFISGKSSRASFILIHTAIALPKEDYIVYLWMILFTSVHEALVLI